MLLHDNPTQAALYGYLAGILDGEGTFRICKCTSKHTLAVTNSINPRYAPYIGVGISDKDTVLLLAEELGGSVRVERAPAGHKPIYRWTASGRKMTYRALILVMPYLRIKRRQAELLEEFILDWEDLRSKPQRAKRQELLRREGLYQKCLQLNAVGAAATTERDDTREGEATV